MNEQVTDISQAFKKLTSEMASMRKVMDAMHTENVNLRRTVEKLRAENRTLRKQLEKYEGPKKNSNNSSTPPSKEPMKDEGFDAQSHYGGKADSSQADSRGMKDI